MTKTAGVVFGLVTANPSLTLGSENTAAGVKLKTDSAMENNASSMPKWDLAPYPRVCDGGALSFRLNGSTVYTIHQNLWL